MPVPKKIESLHGLVITQLACGDSHSMALTKEGWVYAWGEATLGQLGLDDIRDLPKNTESKPYQPYPTRVQSLNNKKIIAISCGETHTLALTDSGHLYSFGRTDVANWANSKTSTTRSGEALMKTLHSLRSQTTNSSIHS